MPRGNHRGPGHWSSHQTLTMILPMTEEKISEFAKVRMLVVLHDFHGMEVGALWADIKFDR